jgi:hypothetical protein
MWSAFYRAGVSICRGTGRAVAEALAFGVRVRMARRRGPGGNRQPRAKRIRIPAGVPGSHPGAAS